MSRDNHAKGQQDAAEGKYDPPHSVTKEFFSFGQEQKDIHADNAQYQAGRDNHNNQT